MIADTLINNFVEEHKEETVELLKVLTGIPAPTGSEQWRAEFIHNWLTGHGVEEVIIDPAGNVICPYHCSKNCDLLVVSAHMDTVFSEQDDYTVREQDGKLFAPGIGDDTANLVNMLMTILFLQEIDQELETKRGILFVANVGEEGLGNLKGSKAIYEAYKGRIRGWISFDLYLNGICNHAVGSYRYRVTVKTKGGHSFGDYGNPNAIAVLSRMITELYSQEIPAEAKTTINVGKISGGTTVNSIASDAAMLYEFRSESNRCLVKMEESFRRILEKYQVPGIKVETDLLGIRPGHGEVDEEKEEQLSVCCLAAIKKYFDGEVVVESASTDCNIPLSQGIPAVTFGTVSGGALHTKEEWIEKESMVTGQKVAIFSVLTLAVL